MDKREWKIKKWKDQISIYEELDFKEAQELYKKAISTEDLILRKEYMDKLILGTLHFVPEIIKKLNLDIIESSKYDTDDIINSVVEVWIEKIQKGLLLDIKIFSDTYRNQGFFDEIYQKMGITTIDIIRKDKFLEVFIDYVEAKNSGLPFNYERIDSLAFWVGYYHLRIPSTILLFESMYEKMYNEKIFNVNMSRMEIIRHLQPLINNVITQKIPNWIKDNSNMENEVIGQIECLEIIKEIDKTLTNERKKDIIYRRFGILQDGIDKSGESYDEIAEELNATKTSVKTAELSALVALHKNEEIKRRR